MFKGSSTHQSTKFKDKNAMFLQDLSFPPVYNEKVDISHIKILLLKPYISKLLFGILEIQDEVLEEYVLELLQVEDFDPKQMQISLTSFLSRSQAYSFCESLYSALVSAMQNKVGIPQFLLDEKKLEVLQGKNKDEYDRNRHDEYRRRYIDDERRIDSHPREQRSFSSERDRHEYRRDDRVRDSRDHYYRPRDYRDEEFFRDRGRDNYDRRYGDRGNYQQDSRRQFRDSRDERFTDERRNLRRGDDYDEPRHRDSQSRSENRPDLIENGHIDQERSDDERNTQKIPDDFEPKDRTSSQRYKRPVRTDAPEKDAKKPR